MTSQMPSEAAKEIEHVKGLVARHFPVYDVRVNYDVVEFYCKIDESVLEESFDRLREEMTPQGYIPMVTYEKGEHVIVVAKKPPSKYKSRYVNLAMLIITFITITIAGMFHWAAYADVPSSELFGAETFLMGILVFTLPILAILGAHEFGHYLMAKRKRVAASLPFFLPFVYPLGTLGAAISLREPIPNRKSMLDIGIAGPLAGLLVTLPIAVAGLMLTNAGAQQVPDDFETGNLMRVDFPLLYLWLENLVPIEGDYMIHPMAFAAYVGFFVTALNLLPAGPLDGGHIARALLGKNAKFVSWVAVAIMIALSFYFLGWLILAVLIIILGARHPPPLNDISRLDGRRMLAGIFAFVILVIAFVPIPLAIVEADHSVEVYPSGLTNATLGPGESVVMEFYVENTGNVKNNITVEATDMPHGWTVGFRPALSSEPGFNATWSERFDISENITIQAMVTASSSSGVGNASVIISAISESAEDGEDDAIASLTFTFDVVLPELHFWVMSDSVSLAPGEESTVEIQVNNTGSGDVSFAISAVNVPLIGVTLFQGSLDPNATGTLNLTVPGGESALVSALIFVSSSAEPGDRTIYLDAKYMDSELATLEIDLTVT